MKKQVITIVAFQDGKTNSIAYKKFEVDKKNPGIARGRALDFFCNQLAKKEVKTISTRKCQVIYERRKDK